MPHIISCFPIKPCHTNTIMIDVLWKWWAITCGRPLQRAFVVGMLISVMPPLAHIRTCVHWVFKHCSPPARVVMSFCLLQHRQRRQARRERERTRGSKGWRRETKAEKNTRRGEFKAEDFLSWDRGIIWLGNLKLHHEEPHTFSAWGRLRAH